MSAPIANKNSTDDDDSGKNSTTGGSPGGSLGGSFNCTTGNKQRTSSRGKGKGSDDPLVPGSDDVAKRWQCVPCPEAGQNPSPNTWRGCCTPPLVWNGAGCSLSCSSLCDLQQSPSDLSWHLPLLSLLAAMHKPKPVNTIWCRNN